jgi:hypothetical protein
MFGFQFKMWLLKKLEPWYEEVASYKLAWRVFQQRTHVIWTEPDSLDPEAWEKQISATDKLSFVDLEEVHPDYLRYIVEKW